jgi:hypothetical protein
LPGSNSDWLTHQSSQRRVKDEEYARTSFRFSDLRQSI